MEVFSNLLSFVEEKSEISELCKSSVKNQAGDLFFQNVAIWCHVIDIGGKISDLWDYFYLYQTHRNLSEQIVRVNEGDGGGGGGGGGGWW